MTETRYRDGPEVRTLSRPAAGVLARSSSGASAARAGLLRRLLWTGLRTVVTCGLLWLLASRIDARHAVVLIAGAGPGLAGGSLFALLATTPFNAVRWRALCDPEPGLPPALSFWKILLVGLFFNQMLPSGIGGDAVRAWRCQQLGLRLGIAVRSILLERASGYVVYLALLAAALPGLARAGVPLAALLLLLAAGVGGLVALFVLDLLPGLARLPGFAAWLSDLSAAARRLATDRRRLAATLGLSAISAGLTVLGFMLAGAAVGIDAGYGLWLAVVPPVLLIQVIPVSLAGWGVREVALAHLLGAYGIGGERAVAASVLFGLVQIAAALPGGLVWLAGWDMRRKAGARTGAAG
ncbi:MAG: lysylphosphatidylglycerol synthase transmembrane domain-containing protein [Dongiaceae bacterium]